MESKKRDVPVNISTFTRHYFTSKANEKLSIAEVRNLHDTSHRSFLWGSMGIGAMILLRARRMMILETRGVVYEGLHRILHIAKYGFLGLLLSVPLSLHYITTPQLRSFLFQTPVRAARLYTMHREELLDGTSPLLKVYETGKTLKDYKDPHHDRKAVGVR